MMSMALMNSTAGLPISLMLNILIAIPLVLYLASIGVDPITNAIILAIPFFIASALRIFFFDWFEQKYNINIRPDAMLSNIISWVKP